MDSITVKVLLFSVLKEQTGFGELTINLAPPATGSDLLDTLCRSYPALGPYRPAVRLAVNHEYVSDQASLSDEDEIALITPVSGG